MLVAVDKFTKWVEASPVTTQDSTAAINFIVSIVFRFRVPHRFITKNGTNFTSKELKNYCESMGIKLKFTSVAHPKTNGQVEKANGIICNGIKKRLLAPLEKAKHAWVDELPSVLWSLRTTPNPATQETPFFLVHGAEVVLLVEITHEAPRIAAYDKTTSTEALQDDVDALDEARCSVGQSYTISAKSTKLPQYSSSPPLFRSGKSSLTTQVGRPWQVRITMARTLYSHRSHPRRSVSTVRQKHGQRRK
jgi:hypothetical protein